MQGTHSAPPPSWLADPPSFFRPSKTPPLTHTVNLAALLARDVAAAACLLPAACGSGAVHDARDADALNRFILTWLALYLPLSLSLPL